MRPVGLQADLAVAPHRGDVQPRTAEQSQVEGIVQALFGAAVHSRKRGVHAAAEQAFLAARLEGQVLAVQAQPEGVLDAAHVADAHRQERLVEAVVGEVFVDAVVGRQQEVPADPRIGVIQARLVDAAMAQLGVHLSIEGEGFRQEVQPAAPLAFLLGARAGLLVDLPLAHRAGVGHHQQRTGDLLRIAGTACDVLQHAIAIGLPLADQAVDHQQGNQQQQDQHGNGAELEGQDAVHRESPCGWNAQSLGGAHGRSGAGMWRLCGDCGWP
ncbi:hypothetical protein D3C76_1120040 [compost metagenome]